MRPTNRFWYIAIEGAIGVGKTTLARMLRDHFGSGLLLEAFEENPFLPKFYESRPQYAFQTQMFFLLSRFRQQSREVPRLLGQGPLISDYLFAKDRLFAQLNLAGDEWDMYQQIQQALAERIQTPDLIIYLQADIESLMARISHRDRTYERDMDRDYLESLRQSYERFFSSPQPAPVLYVDTNPLNIVTRESDFQVIVDRVRGFLQEGPFQQPLPQFELAVDRQPTLAQGRPLADYQQLHEEMDKAKGFHTDIYFNYLCLSEEMGELGHEIAKLWQEENTLREQGHPAPQALQTALDQRRREIAGELADCMAYLLKLANYTSIDLETAYLAKMQNNRQRTWRENTSLPSVQDLFPQPDL
ncbi:MAG: deoxynucleoside kinase [Anaerolineae bacterium]|nr:deoxynucleoside kinase [Anaerolineae bacterium]